jgi:hypothetical protein
MLLLKISIVNIDIHLIVFGKCVDGSIKTWGVIKIDVQNKRFPNFGKYRGIVSLVYSYKNKTLFLIFTTIVLILGMAPCVCGFTFGHHICWQKLPSHSLHVHVPYGTPSTLS